MPEESLSTPSSAEWRQFLYQSLGMLAVGSLLAAAVCFIAYNWNDMGVSMKFALAEAAMLVLTMAALWFGMERWQGSLAFLAAVFLVGPLLAIYGQAYPTGAPLSKLLFMWAGIAAAAAALSGSQGIWILALAVLNSALYHWAPLGSFEWLSTRHSTKHLIIGLCDLAVWVTASIIPNWLPGSAGRRMIIAASAIFINIAYVQEQFSRDHRFGYSGIVFFLFLIGLGVFASLRQQLFELVLVFLGAFSLVNTMLIQGFKEGGFFMLTVLNLAAGTAAAYALNRLYQEWRDEP